jgi:diguanylate cyclase (GGDEF)-like protein
MFSVHGGAESVVWQPDLRTVLFYGAATSLLVALVLWIAWPRLPRDLQPVLRWWLAGLVLQPSGYLLIGLHNQIPELLCTVGAGSLLASGLACAAIALRRFSGMPERRAWRLGIAGVTALAVGWLTFVSPDLHLRAMLVSTLLALLAGSSAHALLRRAGPAGAVSRLTGGLFAAGTLVLLIRGLHTLTVPVIQIDQLPSDPIQALLFALFGTLPVLSTVGFLLMCTERSHEALETAAHHDHLTGIFNRRAVEEAANQAIAAARRHGAPLTLLIIDIDHFKRINDNWGHHTGDLALVEAVRRIRSSLRGPDLVGRLGGEEFVAVLPNTDGARGLAAGERIRAAFDGRPIHDAAGPITVTVSIGVSILSPADHSLSHLLRRADRAMYSAKAAGRNCVMADAAALAAG